MATDGRLYQYAKKTTYEQIASDLGLNVGTTSTGEEFFYFGDNSLNGFRLDTSDGNVYPVINSILASSSVGGMYISSGLYARATEDAIMFSSAAISNSYSYAYFFLCAKCTDYDTGAEKVAYVMLNIGNVESNYSGYNGRSYIDYWTNSSTGTTRSYVAQYTENKSTTFIELKKLIVGSLILTNVYLPISQGYYGNNTIVTASGKYVTNKNHSINFIRPYLKIPN